MDTNEALREALDEALGASGLSVNALADATLIPRATLQRLMRYPFDAKSNILARAAIGLGTTPSTLWARAEAIQSGSAA